MKPFLPSALALAGSLALGLAVAPAHAQLVITSAPTLTQSVALGGLTTYSATLQNNFSSTVYFLGDNTDFTFAPGPTEFGFPATSNNTVVLDDGRFSFLLPGGPSLGAGQSQTFILFSVAAGTAATTGTYQGFFTIQGSTDPSGTPVDLATQNFQTIVTPNAAPVPEASTLVSLGLMLALGLGGTALAVRKKKTALAA